MNRLQRDLNRARARYERAIAELDARAGELERRARSQAVIEDAMLGPEDARERSGDGPVSLDAATFEDLRSIGLSMTQARRLLEYRRQGFLDSIAGLDQVPGIPHDQLIELKRRLHD